MKKVILNRSICGIPSKTEFRRVRKSPTDIRWYAINRNLTCPDGTPFFFTDGFVMGRFPKGMQPRCWYPGLFSTVESELRMVA